MASRVDIHVACLDNTIFKLQRVSVTSTVRRIKEKLHKALAQHHPDQKWSVADMVLLSPTRGLLADDMTVDEAGLADGQATLLTTAEYAAQMKENGRGERPPSAPVSPTLPSALRQPTGSKEQRVSFPTASQPAKISLTVLSHGLGSGPFVLNGLIPDKHTIAKVKRLLAMHTGLPVYRHVLVLSGRRLDDSMTLATAGITTDTSVELLDAEDTLEPPIHLATPPPGLMGPTDHMEAWGSSRESLHVAIEKGTGDRLPLVLSPTDSVKTLKKLVSESWGHTPDEQTMVFLGRVMDDEATLGQLGVTDRSIITLILKAGQAVTATCKQCGLPRTTPFCTVTGKPHEAASGASSPSGAASPTMSTAGLVVPPAQSGMVTLSVLCDVDKKEYRLPSLRPQAVTVKRVKTLLAKATGIPLSEQVLKTTDGMVLRDPHTLYQCGIENAETLYLSTKSFTVPSEVVGAVPPTTVHSGREYPALSPPTVFPTLEGAGAPASHPGGPPPPPPTPPPNASSLPLPSPREAYSLAVPSPVVPSREGGAVDLPPAPDMMPSPRPKPSSVGLAVLPGQPYQPSPLYPTPPPHVAHNSALQQQALELASEEALLHRLSRSAPTSGLLDPFALRHSPPPPSPRLRLSPRRTTRLSEDVEQLIQHTSSLRHQTSPRRPSPEVAELTSRLQATQRELEEERRKVQQAVERKNEEQQEAMAKQLQTLQGLASSVTSALEEIKQQKQAMESRAKRFEDEARVQLELLREERMRDREERERAKEEREKAKDEQPRARERDDSPPTPPSPPDLATRGGSNRAEKLRTVVYPPDGGDPITIFPPPPRPGNPPSPAARRPLTPAKTAPGTFSMPSPRHTAVPRIPTPAQDPVWQPPHEAPPPAVREGTGEVLRAPPPASMPPPPPHGGYKTVTTTTIVYGDEASECVSPPRLLEGSRERGSRRRSDMHSNIAGVDARRVTPHSDRRTSPLRSRRSFGEMSREPSPSVDSYVSPVRCSGYRDAPLPACYYSRGSWSRERDELLAVPPDSAMAAAELRTEQRMEAARRAELLQRRKRGERLEYRALGPRGLDEHPARGAMCSSLGSALRDRSEREREWDREWDRDVLPTRLEASYVPRSESVLYTALGR